MEVRIDQVPAGREHARRPRGPRRPGRRHRPPSATSTPGRTRRRGMAAGRRRRRRAARPHGSCPSMASDMSSPTTQPCARRLQQPQIAAGSRPHVEGARRHRGVDQRLRRSPARPPSAGCAAAADRSRPRAHSPRAAAAARECPTSPPRARARRSESTRCMSETRRLRTLVVHQPLQRAQLEGRGVHLQGVAPAARRLEHRAASAVSRRSVTVG